MFIVSSLLSYMLRVIRQLLYMQIQLLYDTQWNVMRIFMPKQHIYHWIYLSAMPVSLPVV